MADQTDDTMTHWTGSCSVASLTYNVNYQNFITVDCTYNFNVENHTKRCGFTFTYIGEVYIVTDFNDSDNPEDWTYSGMGVVVGVTATLLASRKTP